MVMLGTTEAYCHINEMSLLQGTVLYLLRKRLSNTKRTNTEDVQAKPKSKKGKQPAELEPSEADIKKHQKQIMLELRKQSVNHEAVKKLQELSFPSRVEDITSNFQGADVKNICLKYPFLQLEQQVNLIYGCLYMIIITLVVLEQFTVSKNLRQSQLFVVNKT